MPIDAALLSFGSSENDGLSLKPSSGKVSCKRCKFCSKLLDPVRREMFDNEFAIVGSKVPRTVIDCSLGISLVKNFWIKKI